MWLDIILGIFLSLFPKLLSFLKAESKAAGAKMFNFQSEAEPPTQTLLRRDKNWKFWV